MRKFNRGDKVVCINSGGWHRDLQHRVGTITHVGRVTCTVRFDNWRDGWGENNQEWNCAEAMLELLERRPTKQFGIVTFCNTYYK
jgi:hypothetical protein